MEGQVLGTAQPGDCSISDSWPTQSFEPAATNSTTPTCHPFIILQRHWRRITSTTTLGAPRLTDTLVGQPASAISNRHYINHIDMGDINHINSNDLGDQSEDISSTTCPYSSQQHHHAKTIDASGQTHQAHQGNDGSLLQHMIIDLPIR